MKRMKKCLLSGLLTLCAGLFAVGGVSLKGDVAAAETPAYTTEDVFVMGKMTNVFVAGGNVNAHFTLSKTDAPASGEQKVTVAPEVLKQKLQAINFFDNVMMGEKTLTELGFSGDFWNAEQRVSFNFGEPNNALYMSLHADPAVWEAAYNAGEIQFGMGGTQMTFKEGALIPGYNYLTGGANPVVYKAAVDCVTSVVDHNKYTYGLTTYGKTDIDSVRYVQGHDGTCGYFGFSLEGDDFVGNGQQKEFGKHIPLELFPNYFTEKVLVNGVAGKMKAYSLFNLGEAGKGYFSAQIFEAEETVESITIPKGTLFPSRALEDLSKLNANNGVWMFYETQTEKTYYKTEDGYFCLVDAQNEKVEALQAQRAEKVDAEYFAEDVTVMNETLATGVAAIQAANDMAAVNAAYEQASAALAAILTKEGSKAAAVEELNAYKGEEGYFRAEELAQKQAVVATATTAINGATEKQTIVDAVAAAKTQIDALKSAAQYADEELKPSKDAARVAIEGYKADEVYFAEEAQLKALAVAAGLEGVKQAKNEEEIAGAVTAAQAAIDAIKTKAGYVADAIAELNAYKGEEGYFLAAELAQKAAFIAEATAVFETAENAAAIAEAVAAAKVKIDELKTAEQYAIENEIALAPFKEAARTQINEKKAAVDFALYSEESSKEISRLYTQAKDAIAAAVTQEEINNAVAAFTAAINAVEQVKAEVETESGCGSTAIGGVLGMLVLVGAGMLLKKKED